MTTSTAPLLNNLLWTIIIGIVAGFLAGKVMKGKGFGLIFNLLVGVGGAILGGFYDEAMSEKLVKYLFAPRNSIDPAEAYRLFRGRDASIDALMRARGFPVTQ